MNNVCLFKFQDFHDKYGHLTSLEGMKNIPFDIKRIYYISKVNSDIRRGFHAHKQLHQILICLNGSVKVETKNSFSKEIYSLDNPSEGLYIGPMIWREMYDFSPESVLLVLASDYYQPTDYIRNYDDYIKLAKIYFIGE